MLQGSVMGGKILRRERIDARRIDADEADAVPGEQGDEVWRQSGEVLVEDMRVGKGACGDQQTLGPKRWGDRARRHESVALDGNAQHLAGAEVEVEATLVDRRRAAAVMAPGIGVSTKVDRRMESRKGDGVAAIEVAKNLAVHRRVAGPDAEMLRNRRGDVVDHGGPTVQRSPTPAAQGGRGQG